MRIFLALLVFSALLFVYVFSPTSDFDGDGVYLLYDPSREESGLLASLFESSLEGVEPNKRSYSFAASLRPSTNERSCVFFCGVSASELEKSGIEMHYFRVFENSVTGLFVPSYVPIDSIDQLNAYRREFSGRLIDFQREPHLRNHLFSLKQEYMLDYQIWPPSSQASSALIKEAIGREKWIAFSARRPSWPFVPWGFKRLRDRKGVFAPGVDMLVAYSKSCRALPRVAAEIERAQRVFADSRALERFLRLAEVNRRRAIDAYARES